MVVHVGQFFCARGCVQAARYWGRPSILRAALVVRWTLALELLGEAGLLADWRRERRFVDEEEVAQKRLGDALEVADMAILREIE